jgi:hypothetical protein
MRLRSRHHLQRLLTESISAEDDFSGNATLFGDPDPEIFLAAILSLDLDPSVRGQYVQH